LLISLDELKPSPWNPKTPLTKKELAALNKCVNEFGFQRSLCVCKDFQTGEGFFVLDGNDAIKILAVRKIKKVNCHLVEKVTDEKSLQRFMAGYTIHKKPLFSEFATALGEIDFSEFTGLDFGKFSFDVKIDDIKIDIDKPSENSSQTAPENPEHKSNAQRSETSSADERQTQYFLTLPPDCVEKLKNLVKTKAYKTGKTEAIAEKIDAMNDTRFLENILQIIL
jgi:predicted DNA-binding protein